MRRRRLGAEGPEVSVVGLGCNNFGMAIDERETASVVAAALDVGITHFDTAESYGGGHSEEMLGKALGRRRDEVVIATKVRRRDEDEPWRPGALARRIVEGCDISLRRLGTDHIDVYYEHHRDPDAPLDEVLAAFDELVRSGKICYPACSNYSADDITNAIELCAEHQWAALCGAQVHWNLLAREVEAEVVPAAHAGGLGIVPYYPLASGLLTGKYRAATAYPAHSRLARLPKFASVATDANFAVVDAVVSFAEAHGYEPGQLAVAWLLAHDAVASVIAGATTAAQVVANAAAGDVVLGAEELSEIERSCGA
ncbi:MAG: aldo/keto reductase [Actinomycetota bacterium]|jgi:aryl-alcohol dehydrogenase-like predicted oxidoreductase|nr:aldo/keto reductase [Actinomycetota bacterium]MDA8076276.1 aldo/keto reductase [Actinomycetota bacterium]